MDGHSSQLLLIPYFKLRRAVTSNHCYTSTINITRSCKSTPDNRCNGMENRGEGDETWLRSRSSSMNRYNDLDTMDEGTGSQ